MREDKNALSFGRYLMQIRLEKRISLEAVSRATKIGKATLLLIEQEAHERLPDEVFVKGFLHAYAQSVGADEQEVLRRYLADLKAYRQTLRSRAGSIRAKLRFWIRVVCSIGVIAGIVALSLSGVSWLQRRAAGVKNPSEVVNELPQPGRTLPAVGGSNPTVSKNEAAPVKLLLKIIALEKTWLKVMTDGRELTEYHLAAQESLQLEASTGFNLLISNAADVKLTLNGQPVLVYGTPGQFVNVQLP